MSILSLRDLQGINTYSNKVRVPSGHTLEFTGNLKIPVWTTATRPSTPETGMIGYNTTIQTVEIYANGSWGSIGSSGIGLSQGSPATSASAILAANPAATSGLYWIKPSGYTGDAFQVYCDMSTASGGWMHVGTISDNNETSNNSTNHPWGAPLNPTQDTGLWQNSTTLGTQSFISDFKSQAWISCPFTQFLIKDQGSSLRNLLYTNSGQISSNNSSFSTFWASLTWAATGSDSSNSAYSAGRVRGVNITTFGVADDVLDASNKSVLLLKYGEADGAQDGNKDRSMIAWHRHNQADNVDAPAGLGCFTNRSGTIDYRDVIPSAQRSGDFPAANITGAPFNYTLWVR